MSDFKEGDVFKCSLNWEWVFIMHKGILRIYPMDYYNNGKLSEGGKCSFLHDPAEWNLTNIQVSRNIKTGPKGETKKKLVMCHLIERYM